MPRKFKEFCHRDPLSHKMVLSNFIVKYSQTVGQRSEIDEIMSLPLILQRALGQQVLDPKWTWRKFCHFQLFLILLYTYVVFGTLEFLKKPNIGTELIAEASYTLLLIAISPIKLLLFYNNRNVFRKLYEMVKIIIFNMLKDGSVEKKDVLIKTKKTIYVFLAIVACPFLLSESVTFWHYVKGHRITMSATTETLMPMTSPFFEIAWFCHTIFMLEIASIVIIIDMWFVFLMFFFCVASDCLAKMLQVEKQLEYETKETYSERLNQSLRKFYESHVKMVDYLNMLSTMYKWLSLVPLISAGLSICVFLLVLSEEIDVKFAPHILPLFGEVLAYSWFGEQLKSKMYDLKIALLHFDWINLNKKDTKNYVLITSYMQKEFGIKTAIGHNLSLITMTTVLKSSYQAFTVLQTVN